jgi:hypothetical protein
MKSIEIAEYQNSVLSTEDFFQRELIRERERSEKSGHQFMLVLLDVGELFSERWSEKGVLMQQMSLVLNAATRDIDIKGWYLNNTLIGIIYPGYRKEDKGVVVESLRQKTKSFLEPDEAQSIKIYTVFFSNIEEHYAASAYTDTKSMNIAQFQDR